MKMNFYSEYVCTNLSSLKTTLHSGYAAMFYFKPITFHTSRESLVHHWFEFSQSLWAIYLFSAVILFPKVIWVCELAKWSYVDILT